MGEKEFQDWIAFDALEPIGDRRSDVLAAFLATFTVNQWRGKDTQPITPDRLLDLLPWHDPKGERRRLGQSAGDGQLAKHSTVAAYEQLLSQVMGVETQENEDGDNP